jgi:hypothetical protein
MTTLPKAPLLLTLVVLTAAAVGLTAGLRAADIHLVKRPVQPESGLTVQALPRQTEHWEQVGKDRIESPEIQVELGTDNYLSRTYRRKSESGPPKRVELHAAYYTGRVDTVPHVPDRCFVGGGLRQAGPTANLLLRLRSDGWALDSSAHLPDQWAGEIYTARVSNDSRHAPGKRVRLPRRPHDLKLRCTEFTGPHGERVAAGYFFIANGGAVAGADGVRLLAFDLKNDYAYYMKVQFTSFDVDSTEELAALASDLLSDLIGELMLCVPDWVDVTTGRWPPDNPRRDR